MKRLINLLRIGFLLTALVCLAVFEFHAQTNSTSVSASLSNRHTLTGNIQIHRGFESRFLPASRDISIYLPPGYETNQTSRYPVLYMQDGQNVFDAATSFFPGRELHMDEEAEALIAQRAIEPLIIVGISSSGLARVNEFTPPIAGNPKQSGHADLYGRMLVEEIKPFIDANYRTSPSADQTALGGTSLGGLATIYLGLKYKDIFGQLAITSPAAFWDNEMISRYVQSLPEKTNQRIYLSIGTAEPAEFLNSTRDLHRALIDKGWREGSDLDYLELEGGHHYPEERAVRVERALRFISPVQNKRPRTKSQHLITTTAS